MALRTQRRVAAEMLGVGENRVWIDPDRVEDVEVAITREEIRKLIKEGAIKVKPEKGTSRARVRVRLKKKRRRGPGSRKGPVMSKKERWMIRIRAIRKRLRLLRDRRMITRSTYRMLYMKAKGGTFKSTADLERYITEHRLWRRLYGARTGVRG